MPRPDCGGVAGLGIDLPRLRFVSPVGVLSGVVGRAAVAVHRGLVDFTAGNHLDGQTAIEPFLADSLTGAHPAGGDGDIIELG